MIGIVTRMKLGLRRMGDTLVTKIRVLFCLAAACSALLSASFAAADAVDDLLAGKPVVIPATAPGQAQASTASESPAENQVLEGMIDQAQQDASLSGNPVEVILTGSSQSSLELTAGSGEPLTTTNTANLVPVPEPSAILLAVLSLVYFLIFFRRRYSF